MPFPVVSRHWGHGALKLSPHHRHRSRCHIFLAIGAASVSDFTRAGTITDKNIGGARLRLPATIDRIPHAASGLAIDEDC
jgi:hypothetical protein